MSYSSSSGSGGGEVDGDRVGVRPRLRLGVGFALGVDAARWGGAGLRLADGVELSPARGRKGGCFASVLTFHGN